MFSYKPLWKLLIDKGMTKEEMRVKLGLSPSTVAKMGRNEYVAMRVLHDICSLFNCQPNDVIEYIPDIPDRQET